MVQSRVLCEENAVEYIEDLVVDELDMWKREEDMRMREERLARLEKVQEIDFSYHGISSLAMLRRNLYVFRSLRKLDLSHNQLFELPESIGSLRSLTHLFLNDNDLSSLQPRIIRRLVNLQELDLRNNKLNEFSLAVTELSCLRKLSVQGNPLKDDETRKLMKLAHNERWTDIAGECKIL